MDIVDPATRSRMMSGIRSTGTKPEIAVRKALWALGFRYRLYDKKIRGKPDMVFRKYRAVIFVHGCFWHGHAGCPNFRIPGSNTEFWTEKIDRNRKRDGEVLNYLHATGWRVAIVWECCVRGKKRLEKLPALAEKLGAWLGSDSVWLEVSGDWFSRAEPPVPVR